MPLPIRTTVEDIQLLCNYFMKRPTGATIPEARSALGDKVVDSRKLGALKHWGLLEELQDGKLKATDDCRLIAKNNGAERKVVFRKIIRSVHPYLAIVERVVHRKESALTSNEVASHWHDHFKDEISTNEDVLIEQVTCFFQVAEGADIGAFVIGRKGSPTRFEFDLEKANLIIDEAADLPGEEINQIPQSTAQHDVSVPEVSTKLFEDEPATTSGQGIFIAHGKNKKPLEQLKRILDQFKVPYKVVIEEPNLGRPISSKVSDTLRECNCAILIFTADEEFKDKEGNTVWRPSENVVYELGAASFLYGKRVVIMKENEVNFPSNFRDIGYIPFDKDQLEAKAMDVLKELIGFGIIKVST